MRLFRPIACAALVSSAGACTIWYLATDPIKDAADAQLADAQGDVDLGDADDGSLPADAATFDVVAQNVNGLAVYADQLYVNKQGAVYVYVEGTGLQPFVPHDASANEFAGIAVNDGGVFWTADDGIWYATLDGSVPKNTPTITDSNNPWVLAVDGQRLSWTTHTAGSIVVHTCKFARSGCAFDGGGGPTGATGPGEAGVIAPADAGVIQDTLAATSGYVAWVSQATASDQQVEITNTANDTLTTFTASADKSLGSPTSDDSFVANDGTTIFWSFHNNTDSTFVIRSAMTPATSTVVYANTSTPQSNYLSASAQVVGFSPNNKSADTVSELGSQNPTKYSLTGVNKPKRMAMTSQSVFLVDASFTLYRIAR